jgi:holo-[acyl-carrier protein] synthase
MIISIGCDLLEVARMEQQLGRDDEFRRELFTVDEIRYCESKHVPAQHYAARFAAKEALLKALASDQPVGAVWREVEVTHDAHGKPQLILSGTLRELAEQRGVRRVHVTLSHTRELALAHVILES